MNKRANSIGLFVSAVFLFVSNVSLALQDSEDFLTAYRYNVGGQVTGIIYPNPNGEIGEFPATRNIYDNEGRLLRTESGVLNSWADETVLPSQWDFTIKSTKGYMYDDYARVWLTGNLDEYNQIKSLTQFEYHSRSHVKCKAVRMNSYANLFSWVPASACDLGPEGADGKDRITKYNYGQRNVPSEEIRAYRTPLQQVYRKTNYVDGLLRSVFDANGNKTRMSYDNYGRVTKVTYPSKTTPGELNTGDYQEFKFDVNGNTRWERKRNGSSVTYGHDALNQLTMKNYSGFSTRDVYQGYDLRGLVRYARFDSHNGIGITNVYDDYGNLESSTNTMGGSNRTLTYQYDDHGNKTQVTHPDFKYAEYFFDDLDRAYRIRLSGSTLAWINYDDNGKRASIERMYGKEGARTDYSYDGAQRIYTFSQSFADSSDDVSNTFSYNAAYQVISNIFSNNNFHYFGQENREGQYSPNGLNQYESIDGESLSYDGNGNLTNYKGRTYTYDNENRMLSVSGDVSASFEYDPLGRLFKTTIKGSATQYLYDGDSLIAEYANNGNTPIRRYVHGDQVDEPLVEYRGSSTSSGNRRFLHRDYLGSVVAHSDRYGNLLDSLSYDSYGIPGLENEGRFGYTGQIWFPELGLYHYKARMYDPYIGRFLQTDPVGYEDQMNLYAYVHNDPVNMVDPNGEFAMLIGAVVGIGIEVAFQAATGELSMSAGSLGKIALAGAAGATGSGLAAGAARLGSALKLGSASKVGLNLASDVAASAAGTKMQGGEVTVGSVVADVAGGKVGGAAAGAINKSVPKSTSFADKAAQGKGQPNSRGQTRQAIRQGQKMDSKVNAVRDTTAATTGVGLGSKVTGECTSGNSGVCQ